MSYSQALHNTVESLVNFPNQTKSREKKKVLKEELVSWYFEPSQEDWSLVTVHFHLSLSPSLSIYMYTYIQQQKSSQKDGLKTVGHIRVSNQVNICSTVIEQT